MIALTNNLADNIRSFRKEKGLTQEQLAEVFGVTVGAVHKWEAGMSTPELSLILEIADFFDTSLDVLIGFEARDNRTDVLAARLRKMAYTMDPDGIAEAEKALKKYPHNFAIVFECALVYGVYGVNPRENKYLMRSVELFEQSVRLISQNTDPSIDETVIYGQLAVLYQTMGDTKKALEIYQAHNAGGVFDIRIGHLLAHMGDYSQADEFMSRALIKQLGDKMTLISGKILCYLNSGNYGEVSALTEASLRKNASFKKDGRPNFLDKYDCVLLTYQAYTELKLKKKRKAKECLKKAEETALAFDEAPDYDVKNLRFVSIAESMMIHDSLGHTGIDAIETVVASLKSTELEEMWRAVHSGG